MSLTNQQFQSIKKGYEERQNENRHIWLKRRDTVYQQVTGYEELENSIGSISVTHAHQMLNGDPAALKCLHNNLKDLTAQKKELLISAGFPENYLEPVYTCPDCQDTGYVKAGDVSEKCHCFRQQEISILYDQSNIRSMIENENFSALSYEYYDGEDLTRFENAVSVSRRFIEEFPKEYYNLFFYGTVGTGKSFLSGCIARELLQRGYSVIYFCSSGLFEQLARYSFDIKAKETLYNFYKDLYNCDLIIIDDLGTEVTNGFITSQLFSCLNERHLRKRHTIISTNLNLEELRGRYSDRIFSRITSNYQICKLSGPDIRMYKKRIANRLNIRC